MSKITPKRVILIPSSKENSGILAAAMADPDAQPLSKKQLKQMMPLKPLRGLTKVSPQEN
jgi:hypothetical protein